MMLTGAEAIAARAHATSQQRRKYCLPEKIVKSSLFETDIYRMHSESFGYWRLNNGGFEHRFFSYYQCILKKIDLINKARNTIRHRVTKENNISGQKGERGGAHWAHR